MYSDSLRRPAGALLSVIATIICVPCAPVSAQDVPAGIEPWRLVRIFIEKTGSPYDEIDRNAFAPRLGGRLSGLNPEALKGRWERYVDVKIDTLILLPPRFQEVPPIPEKKIPRRTDTIDRAAVWATTYKGGNYDNSYFFLEKDSIWKIVEMIEFPTTEERGAIVREAGDVDTSRPDYIVRRRNILNILHHDIIQRARYSDISRDLSAVARVLERSSDWSSIELGMIPLDSLDPFAPLDLPPKSRLLLLHRLNPRALNRLFEGGISRIDRRGPTIRFEIGRFGGRSVGFLWGPADSEMNVDETGDFLLTPVDEGWWFYKSFHTPESAPPLRLSLPEDFLATPTATGEKTGDATESAEAGE